MNRSNYSTVNKNENVASVNWCLSVKQYWRKYKQVSVELSTGKAYEYATDYSVAEGDIVIIGKTFPRGQSKEADYAATTGIIGVVKNVEPKLTLKGGKAANLDFVFTEKTSKKTIEACADYLDEKPGVRTLQYGYGDESSFIGTVFPITFFIRQTLAAASILAHKELALPENVEKAKKYLISFKKLNKSEMDECTSCSGYEITPIDLCDIQVDVGNKIYEELDALEIDGLYDGIYEREDVDDADQEVFDRLSSYVNKYVNFGAVSVLVRGGFVNILKAYLSVNPPISEFLNEMVEAIGDHGHPDALSVLKEYKP